MLTDEKRDELLIRLDERLIRVRNDQKELKIAMNSPEGFTRCQLHNKDVKTIKWQQRTVFAAFLGIIGKLGFDFLIK
jgi:hypothetical protein